MGVLSEYLKPSVKLTREKQIPRWFRKLRLYYSTFGFFHR
jgi:hypothetical protein